MLVSLIEMELPCVDVFEDQISSDTNNLRKRSVAAFDTQVTICMQDFEFSISNIPEKKLCKVKPA